MEAPSERQQSLSEFFAPSKSLRIWGIVLAIIVSLFIIGAAYEFTKPKPEPARMTHETSTDTYVYLDVFLLSDWIYDVSGDESYTFYAAMDPDGNWFVVSLDEETFSSLSAHTDAYNAYWTDDYANYAYPLPTRLYGMPTYIISEDSSDLAQHYDFTLSEFNDLFGENYLNEGASNEDTNAMLFIVGAGIFGLFLLAIVLQLATVKRNYKKSDERLYALGLLDEAENQFLNQDTSRYGKMKLVLSKDFAYVGSNGSLVPYTDIAWLYKRTQRSYGITVATQLMAGLTNGKQIFLAPRHANDAFITEVAQKVLAKNPDCLIGYSFDLAKQYHQRVKEYKANNPK
jgi:hypothetical protein